VVGAPDKGLAELVLGLPGHPLLAGVAVGRAKDPSALRVHFGHQDVEVDREAVRDGPGLAVLDREGHGRVEAELGAELRYHVEHLGRGRGPGRGDDELPDGVDPGVALRIQEGVVNVGGGPAQDPDGLVLLPVQEVGHDLRLTPAPGADADGLEDHDRPTVR
jgi:hypothetical protein